MIRAGRYVPYAGIAVAVVAAYLAPTVTDRYQLFLLTWMAIYAVAGSGLVVLIGWTGQIAVAQAGLFGVGAYGTTWLVHLGAPWPVAALGASLVGTALGVLIGLPAIRLRGFYLAICTLAFGELLHQVFVQAVPITHGPRGLAVDPITVGDLDATTLIWYLSFGTLALVLAVLVPLGKSRLGRALKAVRDIEVATGSLGLSAANYKLIAFAISAFLGGLGGALFSQFITYLTPDIFELPLMVLFLVQVLGGGVARLSGAVIGAVFVVGIREVIQALSTPLPQFQGSGQSLIFGLALLLVVGFLPNGFASLPGRLLAFRPSSALRAADK